jgi:hypothetical protein
VPHVHYPSTCDGTTDISNATTTISWTLDGDYDATTGLTQATWFGTVQSLMNTVENRGDLVIPANTLLASRSYTFTCSVNLYL